MTCSRARLLGLLAGLFLVEHRGRERRRAALVALRVCHDPSSRRADQWIARRGIVSSGAPMVISCGYCRRVGSTETPQVFGTDVSDRAALVHHFHERGWVIIDAIEPVTAAKLPEWVDEVAALADGERGVLQHFELTDSGPQLCRSENFVPIHAASARCSAPAFSSSSRARCSANRPSSTKRR